MRGRTLDGLAIAIVAALGLGLVVILVRKEGWFWTGSLLVVSSIAAWAVCRCVDFLVRKLS